jgi:hypothetical protein
MDPRPVSAPLAAALVVLGTVLAVGPALLATGVVAGLPLALYALVRAGPGSRWLEVHSQHVRADFDLVGRVAGMGEDQLAT